MHFVRSLYQLRHTKKLASVAALAALLALVATIVLDLGTALVLGSVVGISGWLVAHEHRVATNALLRADEARRCFHDALNLAPSMCWTTGADSRADWFNKS